MKRAGTLLLALVVAGLAVSFVMRSAPPASASAFETMLNGLLDGTVASVRAPQLAEEISSSHPPVLLDSRERQEFEVSHLPGARWIGYDDFDPERIGDVHRDTSIVIYCSVGKRSEIIGEQLQEAGFQEVRNLRGGIFDWANHGLRLETAEGEPTGAVHPFNRIWGRWLHRDIEKRFQPAPP